jgi:hypothetical protein
MPFYFGWYHRNSIAILLSANNFIKYIYGIFQIFTETNSTRNIFTGLDKSKKIDDIVAI